MIYELIFILLLGFILRFIFILGQTCDQDFHLYYPKVTQEHKLRFPALKDSLIKGYLGYPSLPHYIVSWFPRKIWPLIGRALNIGYDLLTVIIVYFLAVFVFSKQPSLVTNQPILSAAGWVGLLYATAPTMFPITARLKAMGGRTMGPLLTTIYFIFVGAGLLSGHAIYFLLAFPFGILTILASIFGFQVLAAFSFLVSLFVWSPWPIVLFVSVVLVGIILPGLDIKKLLTAHVTSYRWYLKSIDKNSPMAERNRWRNYKNLWHDLKTNPLKGFQTIFQDTSWFIGLYSLPLLPVLICWLAFFPTARQFVAASATSWYFMAIILSGLVVFVLTSFRPLSIFGQAERYLEYATPAFVLLFVMLGIHLQSYKALLAMFVLNIFFIIINFIAVMGESYWAQLFAKAPVPLMECVEALQKISEPRILTIPSAHTYLIAAYLDHPKAQYHHDWIVEPHKGYQYMLDERPVFQFSRPDFDYFISKYGVNTVVVKKRYLEKALKFGIQYSFTPYHLLFENEEYAVYSLSTQ